LQERGTLLLQVHGEHANLFYYEHAPQGHWDEGLMVDLRKYEECTWAQWRLPASAQPDLYRLDLYTTLQVCETYLFLRNTPQE
jgi:hypothetical protein